MKTNWREVTIGTTKYYDEELSEYTADRMLTISADDSLNTTSLVYTIIYRSVKGLIFVSQNGSGFATKFYLCEEVNNSLILNQTEYGTAFPYYTETAKAIEELKIDFDLIGVFIYDFYYLLFKDGAKLRWCQINGYTKIANV